MYFLTNIENWTDDITVEKTRARFSHTYSSNSGESMIFIWSAAQRQIEVAHRKSRHIDYLVLRLKHRANRARNAPIPANAENMIVVDMVLAPPNIPRTTIGAVTVVPIFAP